MKFIALLAIIASVSATSVQLCSDPSCSASFRSSTECGKYTVNNLDVKSVIIDINDLNDKVSLYDNTDCSEDSKRMKLYGPTPQLVIGTYYYSLGCYEIECLDT